MAQEHNGIFEEGSSSVTVKERLSQYLSNWPLFLVCTILCVSAGILYTRYLVPKYMATTSFLVKDGNPTSGDLIESALNGKGRVNLNNEILLMSSASLMQQTVAKNGFNISYFKKDRVLNIDIYKEAPFRLVAKQITDSNRTYEIQIKNLTMSGGSYMQGPKQSEKLLTFFWNKPISINGQVFVLEPKNKIESDEEEYIVRWQPIGAAAGELLNDFSVKPYDTKSSVLVLSLKTENLEKGKDILNALLAEYNFSDIEDQNKLAERTIQFIDDRLVKISEDLKGVEGNMENFQGSNQLIDIKSQSSQSMENSNVFAGTIKDLNVQRGVVSMILEYFTNPVKGSKLVPSSLGLNDVTLASLINQYNELQLKRDREAPLVTPNSMIMQDMNAQIENLKGSIMESLNNISKNLRLRESNFQQQNNQTRSFLSSVPHKERVMQEIKRKQSITEGLYLYLLQKREEQAISSTALNVAHYKQIDLASGYGPVEPNSRNIIMYTALLGLFLPFAWIYLRDHLLNDKIGNREEIMKTVTIPIIGQISHIPKKKKQLISVLGRTFTGEEFRVIRTKLSLLLKNKDEKVIMVTSSLSNEGKSFTSLNLAAICATPGKKVALLEFDSRNPTLTNSFGLHNLKGLFDFLAGNVNDLADIYCTTNDIPTLHVYPAGPVFQNPADLLLSENIPRLFKKLKEQYDYVIMDTPPIGLVSDAFILNPFCDMVFFVIRENFTLKSQLDTLNDIRKRGNLNNIHLILNDVKTKMDSGYYGYYNYNNNDHSYTSKTTISKLKKRFATLFNG